MHSIPHLKFLQFLVYPGFFHASLESSHFLSETCSIFSPELLPIFCFPKQVERSSTNFLLSNFSNSLQSIFPTLYLFATFYFKINIFEFLSLYLSNEYFIFLYSKILYFSVLLLPTPFTAYLYSLYPFLVSIFLSVHLSPLHS